MIGADKDASLGGGISGLYCSNIPREVRNQGTA